MEMTLFSVLSLSLLISLSLPFHSLSEPEHCNSEDKKVFLEIKATHPEYLASWNPSIDCCDWAGVECDETTSRVIALAIFGDNFSNQIPPVVGNLKYLESLVFRKLPNLTEKIPFAITKLMHLKEIRLSWTNLLGPIPSFFALLKNLTFLDLAFNNLTGSIPPEATNQSSKLCRTFSLAKPIIFNKSFRSFRRQQDRV